MSDVLELVLFDSADFEISWDGGGYDKTTGSHI